MNFAAIPTLTAYFLEYDFMGSAGLIVNITFLFISNAIVTIFMEGL